MVVTQHDGQLHIQIGKEVVGMILRQGIDRKRWEIFVERCFADELYQVEALVAELFELWEPIMHRATQPTKGDLWKCHTPTHF